MVKKTDKEAMRRTVKLAKEKKAKIKKAKKSNAKIDKMLIDNFVALQRVLTNLAVKLEGLTDQITKLLNLFEISAKSFAQKYEKYGGPREDREFINKLNTLLEQNKTIAKGLVLIEERLRIGSERPTIRRSNIRPKPLPTY